MTDDTARARRPIRMFADDDVGPLSENDHPNYAMEPADYGLSNGLSAALVEWNSFFGPAVLRCGPSRDAWVEWGERLASWLREEVGDFADVIYEP